MIFVNRRSFLGGHALQRIFHRLSAKAGQRIQAQSLGRIELIQVQDRMGREDGG